MWKSDTAGLSIGMEKEMLMSAERGRKSVKGEREGRGRREKRREGQAKGGEELISLI